jgi:predicted transcriptional regulator
MDPFYLALGHHFTVATLVSKSLSNERIHHDLTNFFQVEQELQGLKALEYQMSRNLETLRERYEDAKFGRTLKGTIFNAIDRLIAIYCVIRIVSVSSPAYQLLLHVESY